MVSQLILNFHFDLISLKIINLVPQLLKQIFLDLVMKVWIHDDEDEEKVEERRWRKEKKRWCIINIINLCNLTVLFKTKRSKNLIGSMVDHFKVGPP